MTSRVSAPHDVSLRGSSSAGIADQIALETLLPPATPDAIPVLIGGANVGLAVVGVLIAVALRQKRALDFRVATPSRRSKIHCEATRILSDALPRMGPALFRFLLSPPASLDSASVCSLPPEVPSQWLAMEVFKRALGDASRLHGVMANFAGGVRANAELRVLDPLFAAALELLDIVDHVGGRPGALTEFFKTYPALNPDSIDPAFTRFLEQKGVVLDALRTKIADACHRHQVTDYWLRSCPTGLPMFGESDRRTL